MKFDEKYPDAKIQEVYGEGMMLCDKSSPCWECKLETRWMDIDFQAPICSEECAAIIWKEFMKNADMAMRYDDTISFEEETK